MQHNNQVNQQTNSWGLDEAQRQSAPLFTLHSLDHVNVCTTYQRPESSGAIKEPFQHQAQ